MKYTVLIIFISIISIIIGLTLTIKPENYNRENNKKNVPDFLFEGVTVTHIDNGEVMIEIQADQASLYRNNQDVELVNLLGRMMEKEQPSFIFLSPYGRIDFETGIITMSSVEGVLTKTNEYLGIKSENMVWFLNDQQGIGTGNVQVMHKSFVINADQFVIDKQVGTIEINENVKAIVETEIINK